MSCKERKISHEKVWIDPKIVSSQYAHGNSSTKYGTYDGKKDNKIEDKKLTSGYCFSNLLSMLKCNKDHNKIYYKMEEDLNQKVKLTEEEKYRWIELCVKHKTMPEYITVENIGRKIMELEVTEDLTPSLIFLYLCCFRYFREAPGFIRAVVYLVDKCGMNYYAAFVFASRVCMNYQLHHTVSMIRKYGEKLDFEKVTIPLHLIIGLARFIEDPKKYDPRGPRDHKSNGSFNQFQTESITEKVSSTRYDCMVQDLFGPDILKAISASTDKESQNYLDAFLAQKDKIVCKKEG